MRQYLKRFRAGGSPLVGAAWYNTVNAFLSTFSVQMVTGRTTPYVDRTNADGSRWVIQIPVVSGTRRWQVEPTGTANEMRVYVGAWTRNGYLPSGALLELTPDAGENFLTSSVGADDYVWAVLQNDAGTKQAALKPDDVEIDFGASLPDDYATAGIYWLLGKFTAGAWEQYWWGGDIDDHWHLPDGDGAGIGSLPLARYTLQRNPEDTGHEAEDQLYNVHATALDTWAIPYFPCDTADHTGALTWAAIDTHNTVTTPTHRSLEVGGTPGTGTGYFQIRGFSAATAATPDYAADTILLRDATDGDGKTSVAYMTFADLVTAIDSHLGDHAHDSTDITGFLHVNLADAVPADVNWHDGRYWPDSTHDADPDIKSYHTSGTVLAGKVGLYPAAANNEWDSSNFQANVGTNIALTAGGSLNLAPTGELQVNGTPGVTATVAVIDPTTGATKTLVFTKGILTSCT